MDKAPELRLQILAQLRGSAGDSASWEDGALDAIEECRRRISKNTAASGDRPVELLQPVQALVTRIEEAFAAWKQGPSQEDVHEATEAYRAALTAAREALFDRKSRKVDSATLTLLAASSLPGSDATSPSAGNEGAAALLRDLRAAGDDQHPKDDAPRRIGDFEIVKLLGRGGMGEVYLARQLSLGRLVALKVLSPGVATSRKAVERFLREAKAAGTIDHPSIVSVHETGFHEGRPYIAMRYVVGETLAEKIEQAMGAAAQGSARSTVDLPGKSRPEESVEKTAGDSSTGFARRAEILRVMKFFEQAARALHAAHERGLIHRDIKPGNIMMDRDGNPVILDFGLARLEEGSDGFQSLTQSGDLLGTPAYMSPEQLMAHRVTLDRRTDVYSLGVTLYECLTLRRPFDAPMREVLYQMILTKEPPNPRSLNPYIPKDLKVVIDTAIEKDRDRRYPTALEFAADLKRVQDYEPIKARPASVITRVRRWTQRNPLSGALSMAFLLAVTLGLTAVVIQQRSLHSKERQIHELRRQLEDKITTQRVVLPGTEVGGANVPGGPTTNGQEMVVGASKTGELQLAALQWAITSERYSLGLESRWSTGFAVRVVNYACASYHIRELIPAGEPTPDGIRSFISAVPPSDLRSASEDQRSGWPSSRRRPPDESGLLPPRDDFWSEEERKTEVRESAVESRLAQVLAYVITGSLLLCLCLSQAALLLALTLP